MQLTVALHIWCSHVMYSYCHYSGMNVQFTKQETFHCYSYTYADIFNIGIKDILVNVFQNSERNSNKNEENQVLTIFA